MRKNIKNGIIAAAVGGLALVAVGSGSAVATGPVTSKDIHNGTIVRKDLHPKYVQGDIDNVYPHELSNKVKNDIGNVHSEEIVDGTIQSKDMSEEARASLIDASESDLGYEVRAMEARLASGERTVIASCPEGKVAMGGGHEFSADGANGGNTQLLQSQHHNLTEQDDNTWEATAWKVRAKISDDAPQGMGNIKVLVTCATDND